MRIEDFLTMGEAAKALGHAKPFLTPSQRAISKDEIVRGKRVVVGASVAHDKPMEHRLQAGKAGRKPARKRKTK